MSDYDWFWAQVSKTDGCWVWMGSRHPRYGRIGGTRKKPSRYGSLAGGYAHRAAWIITHGPIPDGLCVCHACDNTFCVRPDHLWLGTQADNMRDRDAKGRAYWQRPDCRLGAPRRLTDEQVAEILRRYVRGSPQEWWIGNTAKLAKEFGITANYVLQLSETQRPQETWTQALRVHS